MAPGLRNDEPVDYDLTRLGDREFEHLSQALAIAVLGTHVQVFGDGPDGGREATFDGETKFSGMLGSKSWTGYGIVQAKFRRRIGGPQADSSWFTNQVRTELETWANPKSNRNRKNRRPKYLIFTTDAHLSSVPEDGGIDRANELIRTYASTINLEDWAVWGSDQICRYLDSNPAIRKTYAAFITPGDVLSTLLDRLSPTERETVDTLANHAAKEFLSDQWIRLGQAGSISNERLTLTDIGIDLPALIPEPDIGIEQIIAYLIDHGDAVLRPSLSSEQRRHVAIIGGPGQGKSTLCQILCQVYRVALLQGKEKATLGPVAPLINPLKERLIQLGIKLPAARRWPLRVSLSDFGEVLSGNSEMSLLRYLAKRVSARSPRRVTASQLESWLGIWPWLLVLDGLDEIASSKVRSLVEEKIDHFLVDAGQADADLLIIATTRPQGYLDEFHPDSFLVATLRPLSESAALAYATQLNSVRHRHDVEMQERLASSTWHAINEPATKKLMTTPLQVTIMSLLLERRRRAPSSRFALFDAYFDTIFAREVDKRGSTAEFLERHKHAVEYLHQEVGIRLQLAAGAGEDGRNGLNPDELISIVVARLESEGFDGLGARNLAKKIVDSARRRLVLLVPVEGGPQAGFEIRSLQEYMAARAIISGDATDNQIISRIRATATSSYWRNTWLLAIGGIFRDRERIRRELITLLEEIDDQSELASLIAPSTLLSLEIVEDEIAVGSPIFQRLLAKRCLTILDRHPSDEIRRAALALLPIAQSDPHVAQYVRSAIDRALKTTDQRMYSALLFYGVWADRTGRDTAEARRVITNTLRAISTDSKKVVSAVALEYGCSKLRRAAGQSAHIPNESEDVRPIIERSFRALFKATSDTAATWSDRKEALQRLTQLDLTMRSLAISIRHSCIASNASGNFEFQILLYKSSDFVDPINWLVASRVNQGVEQWFAQRPTSPELDQTCN